MGQKQKFILINGRFLIQPVTGVQRYACELINELINLKHPGFKFVIAVPRYKDIELPELEIIKDNTLLPPSLWQQIRLPLIMKKIKAHLLWSPCNIGPIITKNHVISIHDTAIFAGPEWFSKKFRFYYKSILPLLGRTTKRIITVSNFSKQELIKYNIASEEEIDVIPGGVNPRFTLRKSKLLDFPYILTIGSRDPRKNIARLIESWNQIPMNIKSNRKLVIAGGEIHSFSQESFKGIPSDVLFIGYVSDEDLPFLYSGADAFVFPSLYEGFGLPPLEAMACGCPVVASNVASLPEVCGDAAYYVNPYSAKSMAEGMLKVLTDESLKQSLVLKGLKRAKLFKWENSAKEYIKVFERVLSNQK